MIELQQIKENNKKSFKSHFLMERFENFRELL